MPTPAFWAAWNSCPCVSFICAASCDTSRSRLPTCVQASANSISLPAERVAPNNAAARVATAMEAAMPVWLSRNALAAVALRWASCAHRVVAAPDAFTLASSDPNAASAGARPGPTPALSAVTLMAT